MANICKLKRITCDETELLRTAGVTTVEELWVRISEEKDNGLSPLAARTGIKEARLMDLLIAEGLRNSGKFGSTWIKLHWLDLVVLGCLLCLALLIWRAVR